MAISQTQLRSTFSKLIDNAPNQLTITIGDEVYTGLKTSLSKDLKYSEFGMSTGYTFSVIIAHADFTEIPDVDTKCIIKNKTYRIVGIDEDSTDTSVRLDLGNEFA